MKNLKPHKSTLLAILTLMLLTAFQSTALCEQTGRTVNVQISGEPPLPKIIQRELESIFSGTLMDVLLTEFEAIDLAVFDYDEITQAIIFGINIVIEPKGYSVSHFDFDEHHGGIDAYFKVHPAGWSEDDSCAVENIDFRLSDHGLGEFWIEKFENRIDENRAMLESSFEPLILGLPADPADKSWTMGIVMPEISKMNPAAEMFNGFGINYFIDLDKTAIVTLQIEPVDDLIEIVRPRMYSNTLYNIILDRLRERLTTSARIIENMPRGELEMAKDEIALRIQEALDADPMAKQFDAYSSVQIVLLPDEPTARVDAIIESRRYDLGFETFVDIGNESRDSAEVQTRFGYLFSRGIEVFVNFNFFTNDNTLETDLALGMRPSRDVFFAVGYDFERKAAKYFFETDLSTGLRLRGEIFEEDSLNEFGLTYQFQQYFSAGFYTNANDEYWARAIFTL